LPSQPQSDSAIAARQQQETQRKMPQGLSG